MMNMKHTNKVITEIFKREVNNPDQDKLMNEEHHTFEDLWHDDFWDIIQVLETGAKKHGNKNWHDANKGKKSSFKEMHDSMFHHLSHSFARIYDTQGYALSVSGQDPESGVDSLLHLASRALMCYSLIKRGKYSENK